MTPDDPRISRLEDRLADRALQGLTDEERSELAGLVDDPDAEALTLELAAAEAELALGTDDPGALPKALRRRVEADAVAFFGGPKSPRKPRRIVATAAAWSGWAVAAAALLIAVRFQQPEPAPPKAPTLVERLAGVAPRPLSNTGHPLARGAGGSLVWGDPGRGGYLEIRGLAETVPDRGIYQIWIFDETRDERFPVDGGTFSIRDAAETTRVALRPSVEVRKPTLVAVTLEPSGGVVVSDRKRLLLTASLSP